MDEGAAAPHTIPVPLAPSPAGEAWGQRTHRLAGAEESPWGPQTAVLARDCPFPSPNRGMREAGPSLFPSNMDHDVCVQQRDGPRLSYLSASVTKASRP